MDAGQTLLAPREAGLANAVSAAVAEGRATRVDGEAAGEGSAPSEPGLQGQASAAVVMSGTAARNLDAASLGTAPGITRCRANAVSAVVVVQGTLWRDWSAGVGPSAPGEAGQKASAVPAAVVAGAASRNGNTGTLGGAPSRAGRAANTSSAIVVAVGANGGNLNAAVSFRAEGKSSFVGQTVAAVVPRGAAIRDRHAALELGAPNLVGQAALALAAQGEVVRTGRRDYCASVRRGTPGIPHLQGDAVSAVVVELAALWNRGALFCDRAPGVARRNAMAAAALVVIVRTVGVYLRARVRVRAPGEPGLQGETPAAAVRGGAAFRG